MSIHQMVYLVLACLIVVGVYSYAIISSIYESQAEAIKSLNEKNTKLLNELVRLRGDDGA
jgi:hypothetical protein